jgi:hypothetical protein
MTKAKTKYTRTLRDGSHATEWTTEPLSKTRTHVKSLAEIESEIAQQRELDCIAALERAQQDSRRELARMQNRLSDKGHQRKKNTHVSKPEIQEVDVYHPSDIECSVAQAAHVSMYYRGSEE